MGTSTMFTMQKSVLIALCLIAHIDAADSETQTRLLRDFPIRRRLGKNENGDRTCDLCGRVRTITQLIQDGSINAVCVREDNCKAYKSGGQKAPDAEEKARKESPPTTITIPSNPVKTQDQKAK